MVGIEEKSKTAENIDWWIWRGYEDKENKRLAYSGQRPAGMEEGCTGSQGPQRIGELEKEG